MTASHNGEGETVVAEPTWVWTLIWIGFPVLGAAAALGLVAIADWVVPLPWAPLQGPFRLIDSWSGAPLTIGAAVVGALGGLVLAAIGSSERLAVTVGPSMITLTRESVSRPYPRDAVQAVLVDGKQLVILDRAGLELAREKSDLERSRLQDAFRSHGYPWVDADLFAADFRLWVDGLDGLPPAANALLRARARDLAGKGENADELRRELSRLGVAVRDDAKRQYWRTIEG